MKTIQRSVAKMPTSGWGWTRRTVPMLVALWFPWGGWMSVARAEPVAYVGATIHPAVGPPIVNGCLLVDDGKVVALGSASSMDLDAGLRTVDLGGKVIIPGLVDSHSHVGVFGRPRGEATGDGNEGSGPVQSGIRALDAINPADPGVRMALAGGVTTANIMPGSGNVIGGQTAYVKFRGATIEEMQVQTDRTVGGLKMANGENPKRFYTGKKKAPQTRMKIMALQREAFVAARNYAAKWRSYAERQASGEADAVMPDRDLAMESLVEVLEGKRTVHFHSHRADDIASTLRLKEEFGFDLVIQHGTEAYKIAAKVKEAGVPVSMTLVDSPGGKAEAVNMIEEGPHLLHQGGVKVLINTDDMITESRTMLRTAAIAIRGGLDVESTLKAITIHPAEALRLDDRVGSLEAGKDADFVVLSGQPFSAYTRVLETYIEGRRVFDLADPKDAVYQTGGFMLQASAMDPSTAVEIPPPGLETGPTRISGDLAEATEFVIRARELVTAAGPIIRDGVVRIKDGRIEYAGPWAEGNVPAGLPVIEVPAVTPGLIDVYCTLPLSGVLNVPADQDLNEGSDTTQPEVRVMDGFNPKEPLLEFALRKGVTTIHAVPGRRNVIAGQSGVFRTRGDTMEAMAINPAYGMVLNLGESPKVADKDKAPGTRMKTAALIRDALVNGLNYRRQAIAAETGDKPMDRDLKKEALVALADGNLKAVFLADRRDDIVTATRLSREFGLDLQLAMGTEAFLLAEFIAEEGVPVLLHPTMQRPGSRMETMHSYFGAATVLAEAGVPFAISSGWESYVPKTRVIRYEAAMAAVYGLGRERAFAAVTIDAARILGIAEDYGSLEPGKVADLVLYDGDPLEHATRVTHVIMDGKLVYDQEAAGAMPAAYRNLVAIPEMMCCEAL